MIIVIMLVVIMIVGFTRVIQQLMSDGPMKSQPWGSRCSRILMVFNRVYNEIPGTTNQLDNLGLSENGIPQKFIKFDGLLCSCPEFLMAIGSTIFSHSLPLHAKAFRRGVVSPLVDRLTRCHGKLGWFGVPPPLKKPPKKPCHILGKSSVCCFEIFESGQLWFLETGLPQKPIRTLVFVWRSDFWSLVSGLVVAMCKDNDFLISRGVLTFRYGFVCKQGTRKSSYLLLDRDFHQ